MPNKSLLLLGSGPGVGVFTASIFASNGFDVTLVSRNAERLSEDAEKVRKAAGSSNVKVHTYDVDVGDDQALRKTLERIEKEVGTPEVVVWNAARVAESAIGKESVDNLIQDFRIMNVGLYITASWAIPILTSIAESDSKAHPSLFVTGGSIWKYALPTHFSLSMQKAAQVNFTDSLRKTLEPKGVHVATVDIGGVVSEDDPVVSPKNIASKYWELYQEDKSQWRRTVEVGDVKAMFKEMGVPL